VPTLLPYPVWKPADKDSNYYNPFDSNPNQWFFNYFTNLPQWGDDAHKNGVVGEDMQDNESLYLLLVQLSEVTGNPKYAREAEKAIRWYVVNTQSPTTGLFPWGEHLCWDFRNDDVSYSSGQYTKLFSRRYHEGKGPFKLWKYFAMVPAQNREGYWRDDLRPIERYALGLWKQHVWDKQNVYWDRHADYFFPMEERAKQGDGAFPWVVDGCYCWWSAAYATSTNADFKREIGDIMRQTLRGLLARQERVGFLPYDMTNQKHNEGQNRQLAVSIREAAERVGDSDKDLAAFLRTGSDRIYSASGGKPPAVDQLDLKYARSVAGRNIRDKADRSPGYAMTYLGTLERAYGETKEQIFLGAWDDKMQTCVGLYFDGKCPLPKVSFKDTLPIGRNGEHGQFPTHYSAEWGCARFMNNLLDLHVAKLNAK
jgi:hypothetical protein